MSFDPAVGGDPPLESPLHADIRLLGRLLGDTIRALAADADEGAPMILDDTPSWTKVFPSTRQSYPPSN